LSGFVGHHSVGELTAGTAWIRLGNGPEIQTALHGNVELTGGPCPGAMCNVGVAVRWRADSFTWGDTLSDITFVGSGEAPGAAVAASGAGSFAPGRFWMTAGAKASRTVLFSSVVENHTYFFPNSDPISINVEWRAGKFSIDGVFNMITGPQDRPEPALRVRVHAEGRLANRPPLATAGSAQTLECTSPDGTMVSLSGSSTDMDDNVLSQLWRRDPAGGNEVVSRSASLSLMQPLGTQTYAFQVTDSFLQTSVDAVSVTVRDTTAPTISHPIIEAPCGWGGSCDNRQQPTLCLRLVGAAQDACSAASPVMVIKSIQPFLGCARVPDTCCNGIPLGPPQAGNCVLADRRYWGKAISKIVYKLRYAARDASGNESPTQTLFFKVQPGADASNCPAACKESRVVVLNPCAR
jgi:hypothetical protein